MCEIYIQGKPFRVLSETLLASGGNHSVYELSLKEQVIIQSMPYSEILFKISRNKILDEKSIQTFRKLTTRGIPTIRFLEYCEYKNEKGVVVENLNNRNKGTIYVSSNYHPQDDCLVQLMSLITNKNYTRPDNSKSKEFYLSNNKLKSIKNLQEVNKMMGDFIELCTEKNVFFAEDAVFFGVDLEKQTISDILIGDYDLVVFDECDTPDNNKNAMNLAFEEFKMHFVEKQTFQDK